MKQIKLCLIGISLLGIIFACKKAELSSAGDMNQATKIELSKKSDANPLSENEVLENFDDAIDGVSTNTVDDILSPTFQSSSSYIALSSASVDLLDEADVLDSLKFHLNITSNSDPRLIFAANLLNEMVMFPPDSLSSSVPPWLDCLMQAGIGFSFETLRNLTAGGTLWHVGQAIKHMGYKWFAKTVGKTIGKVLTGWGGAMIAAEFTWCMIKEYGAAKFPTEGGGTLYAIDRDSYLLPFSLPSSIFYTVQSTNLTDGLPHVASYTPIYFNSADNKYYSDSSFTVFVPDGYYENNEVADYMEYYHIVNGVAIMAYALQ